MELKPGAAAEILNDCSDGLIKAIQHLRDTECTDIPLLITLSSIQAGVQSLGTIFDYADEDGYQPEPEQLEGKRIAPPSIPVPDFIKEVEDDDPDTEDKDHKKTRKEAQGFFG